MKFSQTVGLIVALVVLLLLSMSMFTITEGHEGMLLRLGQIVKNHKTQKAKILLPGLHFKWPFINNVRKFDIRLQTLDHKSSRVVTAEQKDVIVDYFAKWRIANLPLYYTRTGGNEMVAQTLLQQKLNDALRAEFGKRQLKQVVSVDRVQIMSILKQKANENAQGLGIKVIDVRIKRIDLPTEVSNSVFERMRAERQRVATEFRAEGRSQAIEIKANANAKVQVILATAKSASEKIRAEGDGTAAKIYSTAYDKNPEFYAFFRSLEAYKKTFDNKRDVLVLQPDSQFFKYFNSATKLSGSSGSAAGERKQAASE